VGEPNPWQNLLVTVVTVAGVAVIMWMEAPAWQRETVKRALRWRLRYVATRLAARSGHRAMGDELDGREAEAEAGYRQTFKLSTWRDRL
jgi:hypothetical protein